MRKRHSLSFNLDDERHKIADSILVSKPLKQRSEYMISCIIKAQEKADLRKIVEEAVREALAGYGSISMAEPPPPLCPPQKENTEEPRISEEILDFLRSL